MNEKWIYKMLYYKKEILLASKGIINLTLSSGASIVIIC